MPPKKQQAEPATETVYEVRNRVTGGVEGRHDTRKAADREADRLNREAYKGNLRHLGRQVEFEVVTESGVIVSGN